MAKFSIDSPAGGDATSVKRLSGAVFSTPVSRSDASCDRSRLPARNSESSATVFSREASSGEDSRASAAAPAKSAPESAGSIRSSTRRTPARSPDGSARSFSAGEASVMIVARSPRETSSSSSRRAARFFSDSSSVGSAAPDARDCEARLLSRTIIRSRARRLSVGDAPEKIGRPTASARQSTASVRAASRRICSSRSLRLCLRNASSTNFIAPHSRGLRFRRKSRWMMIGAAMHASAAMARVGFRNVMRRAAQSGSCEGAPSAGGRSGACDDGEALYAGKTAGRIANGWGRVGKPGTRRCDRRRALCAGMMGAVQIEGVPTCHGVPGTAHRR